MKFQLLAAVYIYIYIYIYMYVCIRKLMLSYLSAGLPVEALSKYEFGFLLLLFIWFYCRLSLRVTWGLA